jgi:hypothetical protein
MVRNALHLLLCSFVRDGIEATIDLHGIGIYDFCLLLSLVLFPKRQSEVDGQLRFPDTSSVCDLPALIRSVSSARRDSRPYHDHDVPHCPERRTTPKS